MKITIKNTQIAQAVNLGSLKSKLGKKKTEEKKEEGEVKPSKKNKHVEEEVKAPEAPHRTKARSRSAFAEHAHTQEPVLPKEASSEESTLEIQQEVQPEPLIESIPAPEMIEEQEIVQETEESPDTEEEIHEESAAVEEVSVPPEQPKPAPVSETSNHIRKQLESRRALIVQELQQKEKLGPTGRHIKDLIPPPKPLKSKKDLPASTASKTASDEKQEEVGEDKAKLKGKGKGEEAASESEEEAKDKKAKAVKFKEFRDLKPTRRQDSGRAFDARDRQGLRESEEDQKWRKKRNKGPKIEEEDTTIRPTVLKVRIPISIKDLASEMKLKASQLIAKLFMQGMVATLNDLLDDETAIQLLGQEFGCEITIDTSEEERIRITDKTIKEEIKEGNSSELMTRPPVVAFMGHVDHGKTSLIDAIRASNRVATEAGAITQHIGAFRVSTAVGDICILDTPGHEAFSAMRARGAEVTDIVVLVVAGDEGIRQQTLEAIQHAKAAHVTIVVAINKSDKPNFNPENVYRQLSEVELLPEAWGGQTITVNCSAVTKQGVKELLEMLALQAEVLELKANPAMRARGTVIESEMHKGMGTVATVLIQNGTLRLGDSVVFDQYFGRIKTMQDEFGRQLKEATPSTPVAITGLSGLPGAGQEFIVVKNEKEAKEISEARTQGAKQQKLLLKKAVSLDNLLQQASETGKKVLNIILRADVQGSLEALKTALQKIESDKAEINIIFTGVGEVSEADVQLAAASKAVIIGFHTQIEANAESMIKELGVKVRMHDIIYHAIDDVKLLMAGLLDKLSQEVEKGKAEVRATFKSSQHGVIAGCIVSEGTIHRNHQMRVTRGGQVIAKSGIASLRRVKEDVREVTKGIECGILLSNFNDFQEGDILEAYEVIYIVQEL